MNPTLYNMVDEWLQTTPKLKWHIWLEEWKGGEGFFIHLKCNKGYTKDDVCMAYVGRHFIDKNWLHGLNPADPEFFTKLQEFMTNMHYQLQDLCDYGSNL